MNAKKLSLILCILLIALCISSCNNTAEQEKSPFINPIDFGKKYKSGEDIYYVFEADQTGYCEYKYDYVYSEGSSYNFTISGRADFAWREASDGAVYLFRTADHYYEDHTEGQEIPLINAPIYFSEDFFVYIQDTQYGSHSTRWIKEGSELEQLVKD